MRRMMESSMQSGWLREKIEKRRQLRGEGLINSGNHCPVALGKCQSWALSVFQ